MMYVAEMDGLKPGLANSPEVPMDQTLAVSVLVPCLNERENVGPLLQEISASLRDWRFEIIVIDDGSRDGTGEAVRLAATEIAGVRLIRHDNPAGQSSAIQSGLQAARGEVIVTIDGDGQNDPTDISRLLLALKSGNGVIGLVAGQRVGRKASLGKRLFSRGANGLLKRLLNHDARDTGCGLKALRRNLFLRLPYFDGWHRFLPALVAREGFGTVYLDVMDRPRRHGASKYGLLDRLFVVAIDILGVWWLQHRRTHPLVVEEDLEC